MRAIFAICVVACVLVACVAADKPAASSSKIRKPTKAEAQKNLLDTNVDRFLNLGELDLLKDDAWEELMKDADSTAPKDKTAFKKLVRSSALKAIETYQALLLQIDKLNKANKDTVSFFGVGYDPADQSKPLAERRIGVFAGTTSESAKVTWTGLPDKIHRFSEATGPRVKRSEVGKMLRADPKAVDENKSRARNNDLIADKGKSRLPSRRAREDSISSARPVPAFAELRARRAKSKVRAFNPNLGPGHSVGVNTAPTFTCQHGTITLFVKGGGNVYMLTNQHVAGNGQTACYNNPTTVAGAVPASASANIGPVSHDSNHFIVDAFLDSSLTQLSAADATYGTSWTCNTPSGTALTSTTRIPHLLSGLNMLVQRNVRKEGRTTGVTDGQIRYFGWLLFENVLHLTTHATAGQYVITQAAPGAPFSRPGDSGSPIWTPNSGNVCAQLWGGWQYPIFNKFTYANPIHKVLWWARFATLSNIQLDCN